MKFLLKLIPLTSILNWIFDSKGFQNSLIYLFMKPFEKIQLKNPSLYKAINDYVIAISKIPSIQTDSNPDNIGQYVELFTLAQVDSLNKNLQESNSALTKALNVTMETKKGLMLELFPSQANVKVETVKPSNALTTNDNKIYQYVQPTSAVKEILNALPTSKSKYRNKKS